MADIYTCMPPQDGMLMSLSRKPNSTSPVRECLQKYHAANESMTTTFWRDQFLDIQGCHFPSMRVVFKAGSDAEVHLNTDGLRWLDSDFDPATVVKAAWSVVIARILGSDEAIFGSKVQNTQAILPIRIQLDWQASAYKLLQNVRHQAVAMMPFEKTPLHQIRRVNDEAALACDFQNCLQVEDTRCITSFSDSEGREWPVCERYPLRIECQICSGRVNICFKSDSTIIDELQLGRLVRHFEHILRQLCTTKSTSQFQLRDVVNVNREDLIEIWTRNATVPEPTYACVHDLISEQACKQPLAPAIHAWDGDLTYGQLHELSDRFAHSLHDKGALPGQAVLLCFEKSIWMPVSALAVMKAGGVSVAVDSTTQPEGRLRTIISQVDIKLVVCSVVNEALVRRLGAQDIVVFGPCYFGSYIPEQCDRLQPDCTGDDLQSLSPVKPSDPLYIQLTSGSTGQPKGVVITHQNFCSAITHQQDALGYTRQSRVFDFASYAFDVAWSNILHTLTGGGCLCIPSGAERDDFFSSSIVAYKINTADLTPSFARHVEPENGLKSLSTLLLGGEVVIPADAQLGGDQTHVVSAYGPAECSPTSTILQLSKVEKAIGLGYGAGVCTWVVDMHDPERLAPVGAVGELWLEGPLVGQGYINDPRQTAASFVQDPAWLLCGAPDGRSGRHGKAYRTGDLVQYQEDGSLLFLGRKDMQVKIRGQRLELGEVEYFVRQAIKREVLGSIQVVAETIQRSGTRDMLLVSFVALDTGEIIINEEDYTDLVRQATAGVHATLADVIPASMIPTLFIAIRHIPITATGKVDRRQLNALASSLTIDDIAMSNQADGQLHAPQSETEKLLRSLWAEILHLSPDIINLQDNFFCMTGDSIMATKLVVLARQSGIALTVKDITQHPVLYDMAALVKDVRVST